MGTALGSVVADDFNGDGRPDLAATNPDADLVAVILNDGTGWFGAPANFPAGDNPLHMQSGDFNGDGRIDLVVANSDAGSVSILAGHGDGSFGAPSSFAAGRSPRSLSVGDFNNDGKPDVAVVNFGPESGTVSVLLGDGAGRLTPSAGSPFSSGVDSLVVADFDKDGHLDLAVTRSLGLAVMKGDGAGNFAAPVKVASLSGALATGDFNGDGNPDLTSAGTSFNGTSLVDGVHVLLGDGAGGFSSPAFYSTGGGTVPSGTRVADFNGDGHLDLAMSLAGTSGVGVLLGDGAGHFGPARSFVARTYPTGPAVADFDGDGHLDLAAGSTLGGGVFIMNVTILTARRPPSTTTCPSPAGGCSSAPARSRPPSP